MPENNDVKFTAQQKLACLERELRLRKQHYPRWIKNGTLTASDAKWEIDVMTAIVRDYRMMLASERLL